MIHPDLWVNFCVKKNLSFKSLGAGVGGGTRYCPPCLAAWSFKEKAVEAELVHGSPGPLSSALPAETNDCDMLSTKLGMLFFSFDFSALEPRASCPSGEN